MDLVLTRRGLLRRGSGLFLLGASGIFLGAACLSAPAVGGSSAGTAASNSTGAASSRVVLPRRMPLASLPQPDLPPSADEIVSPGYLKYPAKLFKSVPEPPGKGGDVNALTYSLSTAPTPVDQNRAWQRVNQGLGVNLKMPIVSTADYPNRLNTAVAGSDLPDIITVAISINALANLADFLQSACADLTPFLSGDAIKDFPNLANLPGYAWPPTVFNNRMYTVPIVIGGLRANAPILFSRWSVVEQAGIARIKSVDEFTGVAKQLNNPGTRWSLGATGLLPWLVQVFGGPNQWRESGGKFTRDLETPEYQEAVAYHRMLWDAGLFHPDSASLSSSPAGAQYYAGKFVFTAYANWSSYQTAWDRMLAADPNWKPRAIVPFSSDPNKRAPQFLGPGGVGIVALKKASPERTKELLGVLNYLAAPIGTEEQLLLQYGVQGTDFDFGANGNPVPTERAAQDMLVPWKYLTSPPDFLFSATSPDYVPVAHATQTEIFSVTLANPTVGLYSPTQGSKGVSLNQTFMDGVSDMLFGRQPVSNLGELAKNWRTNGGDQIRVEYEQAFQAQQA
jgi:putative aldouronate transport system substrate-binding protein